MDRRNTEPRKGSRKSRIIEKVLSEREKSRMLELKLKSEEDFQNRKKNELNSLWLSSYSSMTNPEGNTVFIPCEGCYNCINNPSSGDCLTVIINKS